MGKRVRRSLSSGTRFKMSIAKQGKKNPMSGKHHSQETKKLISERLKEYWKNIPLS